jgi:hypothetical protein
VLPGDWEAITSQRPIAIHALENPMESDVGVYMFRKLLRNAVRGRNPAANPLTYHERARRGEPYHCYTQNDILSVPRRPDDAEDREMIRKVGRRIVEITAEADRLQGEARRAFVVQRIEELERSAVTL